MKRRLTVIAVAVGLLAVGGTSIAEAGTGTTVARDTSGCIVLLPDSARPYTICLFPR